MTADASSVPPDARPVADIHELLAPWIPAVIATPTRRGVGDAGEEVHRGAAGAVLRGDGPWRHGAGCGGRGRGASRCGLPLGAPGRDGARPATDRPGLLEEYVETTGAVLGGRRGWDEAVATGSSTYGGAWSGPVFVLTHHPEEAQPADGVTFLNCDVAEAVHIGLAAADGKNLEVLSPTIGRQLLERGLVDEIELHVAPVLLGAGKHVLDGLSGPPIRLEQPESDDPIAAVNLRYRPVRP